MQSRLTESKYSKLLKRIWAAKYLYLIFLPVIAYYALFAYMPMFNTQTGGVVMAFTRYRVNNTFPDLEWVGLHWFRVLWNRADFWEAFTNTLIISFGRLIIVFPASIVLALTLNEVGKSLPKRVYQTIFTFPNFLSWVLVYSVLQDLFQSSGVINTLLMQLGRDPILFLANSDRFITLSLIFGSNIWRDAGWGAIIYMAAISGIDPSLYEAARIDGANRWQCLAHITWPGMKPTVTVLLILAIGNIMNGGFDQIFQFRNPVNRPVLEILDTFVFHFGFGQAGMNQSFAAAAGLFRSLINFSLLLTANKVTKLLGSDGLF